MNASEQNRILQGWVNGTLSDEEHRLLDQVLANDPELAQTYKELNIVNQSVEADRVQLLRGEGTGLRSSVSMLSSSVTTGTGLFSGVAGGWSFTTVFAGLLLAVGIGVGAWYFAAKNTAVETPARQSIELPVRIESEGNREDPFINESKTPAHQTQDLKEAGVNRQEVPKQSKVANPLQSENQDKVGVVAEDTVRSFPIPPSGTDEVKGDGSFDTNPFSPK